MAFILGPNQWGSGGPSRPWRPNGPDTRCCCQGCTRLERLLTAEHAGRTVPCIYSKCMHEHIVLETE